MEVFLIANFLEWLESFGYHEQIKLAQVVALYEKLIW